jgi:hypothetical protein
MPMLTRSVRATALVRGRRRWQILARGCWPRRTPWSAPVSSRPKSRNHQRGLCLARPRLGWHHRQTPLRARRSAQRERVARHHWRMAAIWLVVRTALVALCRQDRSWEGLASGRARQYGCALLPRKTAAAERVVRTLARLPRDGQSPIGRPGSSSVGLWNSTSDLASDASTGLFVIGGAGRKVVT